MKNMAGLAELVTRWEAEIKSFAAVDEGYNLSQLQKKTLFMKRCLKSSKR